MAETLNTEKKTTRRASTKELKDTAKVVKNDTVAEKIVAVEEVSKIVPKDVDVNQFITVKNGFHGRLIYISQRSGERFVWDDFGDEQEIELKELRNAKSSAKAFFENNWFMFDEEYEWVIDYLGLTRMYENTISIDSMDDVFTMNPDEIANVIGKMSNGQKQSISYRARQLVCEGSIDSIKVIKALEEALDTELIEK